MPPWPPGQRGRTWAIALGIAAAAVVAYLPSLGGRFVFDDHLLLESSRLLRTSLWRIWGSTDAPDYWPLTNTVFWLEHRVFGADPLGYRLVTLALHCTAAVLFWRVLERLRVPAAWLAGVLFAIHPVAVESVAWISETKNTLSGVPFLAAVLAWLRFRDSGRDRDAAVAAAVFACALLAKTSTVVLPLVLLLASTLQRRPLARREWAWLAGLLAMAAVFGGITLWFQWNRSMGAAGLDRSIGERIGRAGLAWGAYLWTAFQPFAASVVYADWPIGPGWGFAVLAGGAAALAGLWALRGRGTLPAFVALGHHAVAVLPVLGLVEMAYLFFSPVGNHLQYLALLGPVALVAAGLGRAACGRWRGVALGAMAVLVLALGARTAQRSAAYRDDVSLWTRATAEAPESLTAARLLAGALLEAGRPADAMAALEAAAARIRDGASALRARALLDAVRDRPADAVAAERDATSRREDLGFRYELAVILTRRGHAGPALPLLEDLVRRQPRSADNRYQLASALARTGQPDRAIAELAVGCALAPRTSDACTALAMVLHRSGRTAEVRGAVAAAMRLPPGDAAVDEVLQLAGLGAVP